MSLVGDERDVWLWSSGLAMVRHVTSPAAVQIMKPVIAVAVALVIVRQCRKPTSWLGRLNLAVMNRRHSPLTEWGLSHVQIASDYTMLDVGCGGGRTIARLAAAAPDGKVYGVDHAPASVEATRRHNASAIALGRVDVRLASVSTLPFDANTFDIATAIETHYYWPSLDDDVREILRVLKPGGTLLLIAETYRGRRFDWMYRPAMALLGATYLTAKEHGDVFSRAGFSDVEVFEERRRGWICATGVKPRA